MKKERKYREAEERERALRGRGVVGLAMSGFVKQFDTPEGVNTRYTLQKRVGKGSYGVVYEALDNETGDK